MGGRHDDGGNRMVAGRYRLHGLVGRGGMGTVWRATDDLLGRTVAMKQVRLDGLPSAEAVVARERTMREARIAAALHHPNVVTVFDVVIDNDEPWLVMEYVPARSLGNLLVERGALPPAEVAMIGAQVAAALAAAHGSGIVHRDVKPDNVLVTASPAGPIVKLTDFGISHAAAVPELTATGVLTGTPAYFAPETARGERTDARSDMYSLGATLYAAVEGHPPFGSSDDNLLAFLARIGRGGPPLPRKAGPLTVLLRDLIADAPWARPTAVQAQHALYDIAASMGRPFASTSTFAGPRRPLALVAVGLVAAVVMVAAVLVVGSGAPAAPSVVPAPTAAAPVSAAPAASVPSVLAVEHTADPCSLLDKAVLDRIGSATIEPDQAKFDECLADISIEGGNLVTVFAELDNAPDTQRYRSGWGPPNAPVVLEAESYEGGCDSRVLVPDGSSVVLTAVHPEADRLCEIASEVAEAAAARLADPGIGQRAWPSDSVLSASNACDLLTFEEVAPVTGNSTQSWPGFGNFSCQWGLPEETENNVTIVFARTSPLDQLDGQPGEFGGSPGRMLHSPGEQCNVIVQQREYISDTGYRRIEAIQVHVYGPEPTTCSMATELANIAKSRLASA